MHVFFCGMKDLNERNKIFTNIPATLKYNCTSNKVKKDIRV